jgi:alcohol dehydrogenase
MRALVYNGDQIFLDERRPEPQPGADEALIRPLRFGISSLDVEVGRGLLNFRGVIGHEFVGVVEHVDGDTKGKSRVRGRRVIAPLVISCGRCAMCAGGLAAHCLKRVMPGLRGRDGCFAERFTLPVKAIVAVPDSVDDDHAVFAQPLATAIQAARPMTIEGKPYITVLGDGVLGLLTVQVMAKLNASVRMIGRHPEKLELCEKWGIRHRHVDEIGRRADQDIVVDCTGTLDGLALAMQLVRPRGTIVTSSLYCAFGNGAGRGLDTSPLVLNEVTLVGVFAGPVNEAVAMLARREVEVVSMISRRMKLDDGVAAMQAAGRSPMLKVLLEM